MPDQRKVAETLRMSVLRFPHGAVLATALILAVPGLAGAQLQLSQGRGGPSGQSETFLNNQRALERENERKLQQEMPPSQKLRFDYGGWYNSYFFLFDDGINSSRTLRENEIRLWTSFTADQGVHEGYARMRMTYDDWNHGDNDTAHENDLDGPNLERGWYRFDIGRAVRGHTSYQAPFDLKTKIGRDLVQVGTGYVVDLALDHVQVQGEWLNFETTFTVGKTPSSTDNIDRSRPVASHSNRDFWLIEEKYKGFQRHEPFVYFAWQYDHTPEDPPDLLQEYDYNSRYLGWGSTGEVLPNLRYGSEWVLERGTSYGDRRYLHSDQIKAWAFDQRFDYYFRHKMKPVISAEYMFASGDNDRLGSPTDAEGGNRKDYVDNSFVGFGFRDTGISLAPRLSNIHIWRLGGSFRPLPDVEAVKELELGTDYYVYAKNHSAAAISDPLADQQSGYIGWEMDYYVNYRICSDLSWTVRFGTFFPGQSYSDETTRTFLLTGITWSF